MPPPFVYALIDTQTDFLVVAKDPGVHVHGQAESTGLVAQLRAEREEKLHLVHRLDTPTSGLLVLARNPTAAQAFGELFAERKVHKRYLALSDRKPRKKQGTIRGGMVKARRGAWKLTRGSENEAFTRFVSASVEPGLRGFLLQPRSGRTHQLRVALKSLGAPILGDRLYAGSPADRCYLHAIGLGFRLGGRDYAYWSPPRTGARFATSACEELCVGWRGEWDRAAAM